MRRQGTGAGTLAEQVDALATRCRVPPAFDHPRIAPRNVTRMPAVDGYPD
jgi:hypothetical protein